MYTTYSSTGSGDDKRKEEEEPLMFVKAWDAPDMHKALISEIIPAPVGMHRGALAPAWVFQVKEEGKNLFREEDSPETMDLYQRRLLSLLCGRFVITTRPGATHAERLETSHGIPQDQTRYWWRYWENFGKRSQNQA